MNKDSGQKERLFAHFHAHGWFAAREVKLSYDRGTQLQQREITDIDVLGIRASPDLNWETVIGDCKTLKKESPPNRALWLRGLMTSRRATRGIIVLRREAKRPIDVDHRLFADSLGITLLDEAEFEVFDRAVLFPHGSGHAVDVAKAVEHLNAEVRERYPRLAPFADYVSSAAWAEDDHFTMLRRILVQGRAARAELDPRNPLHVSLFFEATAVFAVALATVVGAVFRQQLKPDNKAALEDALRALLWGGREQYESLTELRRQLVEAKGGPAGTSLALPEWDAFIHLVRSMLDAPRLAFSTPSLLRQGAIEVLRGQPPQRNEREDLMLLKLAALTVGYFAKAIGLPDDARTAATERFFAMIGEAARVPAQPHPPVQPQLVLEPREH